jgi:hypothetical protein
MDPFRRIVVWTTCVAAFAIPAHAAPVSFDKLTGFVGGTPPGTAVYKTDLSTLGLTDILSITIQDDSGGLGGATGQFSGFDLDAILLSTTNCVDSACIAGAIPIAVFDFTAASTFFTPGVQRPPADAKLFGTDLAGTAVENVVATLGVFDANSTTGPSAFGFLSLGDNGVLSFNLLAPVSTTGLFLYIGEVGDNGEVAAGRISVSDAPVSSVPEPTSLLLLGTGLAALATGRRRRASNHI